MKESKKRSFPRPRGGQDAFRGKIFGGSVMFPRQVSRKGGGWFSPAAKRVARLWAPPAPSRRASRGSAGGGFPGFADFTTWDRSAPASEHPARNIEFRSSSCRFSRDYSPRHKDSPAFRPARVPRFEFRLSCPARHACRNSRSRPARAPRNRFPLYNPRALLEIKYKRFPLHKQPVSTSSLPLLSAFLQPSVSGERSDIPRPCLKKQGRAGGVFP